MTASNADVSAAETDSLLNTRGQFDRLLMKARGDLTLDCSQRPYPDADTPFLMTPASGEMTPVNEQLPSAATTIAA